MHKNLLTFFRRCLALLTLFCLVLTIVFASGQPAWAKRASGRVGGSTFRAPSRRAPVPSSRGNTYYPSSGYQGGFGGGSGLFFLPFLLGGGGGGLLSLLVLVTIGGVLVQAFRNAGITSTQSKVTIAKIQVGLWSSARAMQSDLNRLAMESDTRSGEGLAQILQETSLSLLRNPEYWVYAKSQQEVATLEQSEQRFNTLAMGERSKQALEVLSNVNNRLEQKSTPALSGGAEMEDPGEYIVVTLLVAAASEELKSLPIVRTAEHLQKALSTIGAVPASKLLALEVIWEPQSADYTLTADQMVTVYPDLVRL